MTARPTDPPTLPVTDTVNLTTFRQDGTPVATPVSLAVANGHAYFRTYDAAGKTKRLRRNPRVEVAPATLRGTPTGPARRATVRLLPVDEARIAARQLSANHPILHGWLIPLYHRLRGWRTLHFEMVPEPGHHPASAPDGTIA